jgi:hypothetical protein
MYSVLEGVNSKYRLIVFDDTKEVFLPLTDYYHYQVNLTVPMTNNPSNRFSNAPPRVSGAFYFAVVIRCHRFPALTVILMKDKTGG